MGTHRGGSVRYGVGGYRCGMDKWADRVIEYERRKEEFLLEWREEIAAVEAYGQVPVHPGDSFTIAAEYVVPRLGPELTAMARAARRLTRLAAGTARNLRDHPDHPDLQHGADQAWGARQVFAVGLGVHLGLAGEYAEWLAEGLSGYVVDDADRLTAGKAQQDKDSTK